MNEMVSHIEFLLHEHNCVIIPDFGGFVVNTQPSRRDGVSSFLPPTCELVFNSNLTHNDGLLAQSFMKSDQLTFEAAMQRITRDVEDLKCRLRETQRVEMGSLGSFILNDESRFTFIPFHFVRPSLFGLSKANLRPLVQMQTPTVASKKVVQGKGQRFAGVAAVAAAMILMVMFLLPLGDANRERQSAQMIADISLFGNKENKQHKQEILQTEELSIEEPSIAGVEMEQEIVEIPAETAPQPVEVTGPRYYVVMGVYELPEMAKKMIENLQNEGFSDVSSLKRAGRIDVFVATFTNGDEARSYLQMVHENYPSHSDAWILKRR